MSVKKASPVWCLWNKERECLSDLVFDQEEVREMPSKKLLGPLLLLGNWNLLGLFMKNFDQLGNYFIPCLDFRSVFISRKVPTVKELEKLSSQRFSVACSGLRCGKDSWQDNSAPHLGEGGNMNELAPSPARSPLCGGTGLAKQKQPQLRSSYLCIKLSGITSLGNSTSEDCCAAIWLAVSQSLFQGKVGLTPAQITEATCSHFVLEQEAECLPSGVWDLRKSSDFQNSGVGFCKMRTTHQPLFCPILSPNMEISNVGPLEGSERLRSRPLTL